ncbi:hypothetical protein [Streptomyces sp. LN785]|uniref:hypothetical protein n=1 Tax=Streptomyces sp. LN785 TaxID=3112983 RepID=UPI00371C11E6
MARAAKGIAEVALWWAALLGLWMVLISTVDFLEFLVGAAAALVAALAARGARRAVAHR